MRGGFIQKWFKNLIYLTGSGYALIWLLPKTERIGVISTEINCLFYHFLSLPDYFITFYYFLLLLATLGYGSRIRLRWDIDLSVEWVRGRFWLIFTWRIMIRIRDNKWKMQGNKVFQFIDFKHKKRGRFPAFYLHIKE